MKGAFLVSKWLREINLFGTGSNLFDVDGAYKKNIEEIMKNKKREKEIII